MDSRNAEAVLLALADPIVWQCKPYPGGQQYWQGKYQGIDYKLDRPVQPGEPDTEARNRLWCILLMPDDKYSHAPTLAVAKGLCQRYALSDDRSELEAIEEAIEAEGAWYRHEEMKAIIALAGCESRPLQWQPVASSGFARLHFAARGERGSYEVRWVKSRRWIVTFTSGEAGQRTPAEELCFLTRASAHQGCAVHEVSGYWDGTLNSLPSDAIKAFWFDSGLVWQQEKNA